MSAPEAALRQCWRSLVGAAHAASSAGQAAIDDVVARHREPQRSYHTATHVMWVLRHVDALLPAEPTADAGAVRAAALFHDVVYDPRATDNEAASARLASNALTDAGWPASRVADVAELIEATATHLATTPAARVLLDADLAILGSDPATYQAYVNGVRAEYAHVDDAGWRTGRAAVLRSFLGRAEIFTTAAMRRDREPRARANIAAELAALGGPGELSARS